MNKGIILLLCFFLFFTHNFTQGKEKKRKTGKKMSIQEHHTKSIKKKIKILESELKKHPGKKMFWNNLGYFYQKLDKNIKAMKCYKKALSIDQDYVAARYGLGSLLIKMVVAEKSDKLRMGVIKETDVKLQMLQEAILHLEVVVKGAPKLWEAQFSLGMAYFMRGEFIKAIRYFDQVVRINHNHLDSYYFSALANELLNNHKRAVRKYKEYIVKVHWTYKNDPEQYKAYIHQYGKYIQEVQNKIKNLQKKGEK